MKNKERVSIFIVNKIVLVLLTVSLVLLHSNIYADGDGGQEDKYLLKFNSTSKGVQNLITFRLLNKDYQYATSSNDYKRKFYIDSIQINGALHWVKTLEMRGKSTTSCRRKSYNVSIKEKVNFHSRGESKKLKNFALVSLCEEKYFTNYRIGLGLFDLVEMYEPFYSFVNVEINNSNMGIYIVMQKPHRYALKDVKSAFVLRKSLNGRLNTAKIKYDHEKSIAPMEAYLSTYKGIYKLIREKDGEDLYKALAERFNLDNYMRWLAMNYFIRNGDYADELYFYSDPTMSKIYFQIIPWDLSEIFSNAPHEGYRKRNLLLKDQLIYSSEDSLDMKIANDPFLYHKYLVNFRKLMELLTDKRMKTEFEKTYSEIYPYYINDTIMQRMNYDNKKVNYSALDRLKALKNELENEYENLIIRKENYLERLPVE